MAEHNSTDIYEMKRSTTSIKAGDCQDEEEDPKKDYSFWRNICQVDRTMLQYKIFWAFFIGAGSCIITFLPLQMKQLGLSPSRIGLASSIRPFSAAVSTAIIGLISDRLGHRRVWMVGLFVLMAGSGVVLALLRSPIEAPCDQMKQYLVETNLNVSKRDIIDDDYSNHRPIACKKHDWVRLKRDVTMNYTEKKTVPTRKVCQIEVGNMILVPFFGSLWRF